MMMVGLDWERVLQGLTTLMTQPSSGKGVLRIVQDYDVINVSEKIVRIIISYVDYINRLVWHKN